MTRKSTVGEIRARFDADVERFSNLDTGQAATIDSPLHMELVTRAAVAATPHATHVLDIGCGAGNYTLKLLEALEKSTPARRTPVRGRAGLDEVELTLIDLSRPMLDRATHRIGAVTQGLIHALRGDVRELELGQDRYDIVMAAQCLHHLRGQDEWLDVFTRVFRALRPGGSFWIADAVEHELPAVEAMMKRRWGEHLEKLRDGRYRDEVFAYVEKEDTPRPLAWQLDLLRRVGFGRIDVLHKHNRFASFGGVKPVRP